MKQGYTLSLTCREKEHYMGYTSNEMFSLYITLAFFEVTASFLEQAFYSSCTECVPRTPYSCFASDADMLLVPLINTGISFALCSI